MNIFAASFNMILLALLHPFYVSMTDLHYNAKAKTLEVSVRITTDDFEKTLRKNCDCKVDLSAKDKTADMNPLVEKYVSRHLQIMVDNKPVLLQYKGFEQEVESTWSYFEVKNVGTFKKMKITNTLLNDYTKDQINMLHITANGKEVTEKLDDAESSYSIDF